MRSEWPCNPYFKLSLIPAGAPRLHPVAAPLRRGPSPRSRCHAPSLVFPRRVPWCGPVAHRHYAREIRTQCPRLLSAPRRKTQNRPWRLATFSAVGPPDPHMLTSSMHSMKKPLERRRSIGFRQNPGHRKAGAKPDFAMAFMPTKRHFLCRVAQSKKLFRKPESW